MIPDKIVKFIEEHGNAGLAGFRDRNRVPFGSRVCGWRFSADRKTLTAFLPATFEQRILEALLENGQIAITVEEFPLHETYQVKGRYRSHRALRADEVDIVNRTREHFATSIRSMVPDEEPIQQLRSSIPDASFAVDVEVGEIFVQTPGPGAGARIYPTES